MIELTEQAINQLGSKFITSPHIVKENLYKTKALLFDWDGVFNNGTKGSFNSSFSEIDSMGINMLRFGFYLLYGYIPFTAIITGEKNETAFWWAEREHLDSVFFLVKDKIQILPFLEQNQSIESSEIMFCFDDILDISLAKEVGTRWMVGRRANPFLLEYITQKKYTDYITGCSGGNNALREISEIALTLLERIEETISKRIDFQNDYTYYIEKRNSLNTKFYKNKKDTFIEVKKITIV